MKKWKKPSRETVYDVLVGIVVIYSILVAVVDMIYPVSATGWVWALFSAMCVVFCIVYNKEIHEMKVREDVLRKVICDLGKERLDLLKEKMDLLFEINTIKREREGWNENPDQK